MFSGKIVISLDAMGGANAPLSTIEGAARALKSNDSLHLLIFGDEEVLAPFLGLLNKYRNRFKVEHTTSVISDQEKPVVALRQGKDSSMRRAIDAVHEHYAQAAVSSGNTGALMVIAKVVLGDLPGIKRPAIVGSLPSRCGKCILLDLGANSECDEINLFQFAVMGDAYARIVLNKPNPSIGLLNIGVEECKGSALQNKAHKLLLASNLNYKGYIEGTDISEGTVDVVVTDGFSGNLLLKSAEGYVKMVLDMVKSSFYSTILTKMMGLVMKKYLHRSLSPMNPNEQNGAMFIGIGGIVVKSHGSSDSKGVASAINLAYELAEQDINHRIKRELDNHAARGTLGIIGKIKQTFMGE